jgi:ADP-ribose pyrophosphatase
MTNPRGVRDAGQAYQLFDRQVTYDGPLFQVVRDHIRLPNGLETEHEHLHYPNAVSVIPVLENGDHRELLVLEQFRSSVGGYVHEIPAGMAETGEDVLACAQRELEEETGYVAREWTHVATFLPTTGISSVTMDYFLARGLDPSGEQKLDPGECLTVKRLPLDALMDVVLDGKVVDGIPDIIDGKMHVAIFYLAAYFARPSRERDS